MNKTFSEYLKEGGNVVIGDAEADRIDLNSVSRDAIVPKIEKTLDLINKAFAKKYGLPLWSSSLFKNKTFLSGSAFHFFDKAIPSKEFVKYKNTVGDIDTQVDKMQADSIEEFLKSATGLSFGPSRLIGFKKSGGQFITLWEFPDFGINIQIDIELVDFMDGAPTQWSIFSHSSSWADISQGIKGVFHKYLLRAITSKTASDIVLLKGKRKTPKIQRTSKLAFSVLYGLRTKIAATLDERGNHMEMDGLKVYDEVEPKDSKYVTELDAMFRILFDVSPSAKDLLEFNSFVGGASLIKKYQKKSDQKSIVMSFANILWGRGAQGIYRGDPEKDNVEKSLAFKTLLDYSGIKVSSDEIAKIKTDYYKAYK